MPNRGTDVVTRGAREDSCRSVSVPVDMVQTTPKRIPMFMAVFSDRWVFASGRQRSAWRQPVASRVAFYPCCGTDVEEPLELLRKFAEEVVFAWVADGDRGFVWRRGI